MKRKSFGNSQAGDAFRAMPRLRHTLPNQEYDINKSEVVAWMKEQPVLMHYLCCKAMSLGLLVYDKASGSWIGCDRTAEHEKIIRIA